MTDAQMRVALLAGLTVMVATLATYVVHSMVIDRRTRTYDPDTLLFGAQCATCGRWKEAMSEDPAAEDRVTHWLGTHECFPSGSGFAPVSPIPAGRHRDV